MVSNPLGNGSAPVYLKATPNITCSCGDSAAKYFFAPGPNGSDTNPGGYSLTYVLPGLGIEPFCHNLCIKAKGTGKGKKGKKPVYYTSPNTSSVYYVNIFTYCSTAKSCANYAVLDCDNANGDGLADKKGKVVWSCEQQGVVSSGTSVPLTTKGYIKPVAVSCNGGCDALKKKGKKSQVKKKCKLL